MNEKSSIETNQYGHVDIRGGVPTGLTHIPKAKYGTMRVAQICKAVGCDHASVVVGVSKAHGRFKPDLDGIVVPIQYRRKLLARIAAQKTRRRDTPVRKPRDYAPMFDKKYGHARNALQDAAMAMLNLNRYCKHDECSQIDNREIYAIKNRFVELLYQSGKCVSASRHVQDRTELECSRCGGCGCAKCDDSGTYREASTAIYYVLSFDIEGTRFTWHQPAEAVEFNVVTMGADTPMPKIMAKPLELDTGRFQKAKAKALVRWVIDNWCQQAPALIAV